LRGVASRVEYATSPSEDPSFWGRVEALDLPQSLLAATVPSIDPRTGIEGRIEAGGSLSDIALQAALNTTAGRLAVASRITLPGSGPTTWRGAVDADDIRVSKLAHLGINGGGDLRAWFDGQGTDLETLDGRADVAVDDAHYERWRFEHVRLRADANERVISVPKLAVDAPWARARATATYGRDGRMAAALEAAGPGPAEASATLTGRIDPEFGMTPSALQRLTVDGDWNAKNLSTPAMKVATSTGRVDLSLTSGPEPSQRRVEADIRSVTRGLRVGALRIQGADVDVRGQSMVSWPPNVGLDVLEGTTMNGDISVGGLTTSDTSLTSAELSLAISPGPSDRDDASLTLAGAVEGLDAAGVRLASARLDLKGTTDIVGVEQGAVRSLDVAGGLDWTSMEASGVSNAGGTLSLDLRGLPGRPVGTVDVDADATTAAGVQWESLAADIEALDDNGFGIDAALSPAETPELPFNVSVAGTHAKDFLSVTLETLSLRRGSVAWRLRESADLQFRDGIGADGFALENGRQTIAIDGVYRSRGRNALAVDITDLDLAGVARLASVFGIPTLSGRLSTRLDLQGTARKPDLRFTASVADGGFDDWGPADVELRAGYAGETVDITKFQIGVAEQTLVGLTAQLPVAVDLDGQMELLWRREASIDLTVPEVELAETIEAVGLRSVDALDGRAEGRVQISGPMVRPEFSGRLDLSDLTFRGSLAGASLDVEEVSLSSSVGWSGADAERDFTFDARATWRDETIFRAGLQTSVPLQAWLTDVYAGRRVNWFDRMASRPFSVDLVMRPLHVSELPISALAEADAEGVIEGYVSVDGTLRDPEASFDLNVDDFGWDIYRDIYVDLEGSIQEDALQLKQLRGEWDADEILVARGTIPFPTDVLFDGGRIQDQPVDLAVELKPTAFQKLGAIDYTLTRFRGTLAGYLTIGGSLRDPDVRTRLALTNTNLNRTSDSTLGVEVVAEDNRVTADAFVCKQNKRILSAGAEFPMTLDPVAVASGTPLLPAGDVSAHLRGQDVPLADVMPAPLLRGTLENIEGTLTAGLRVSGDWTDLHPSGSLTIRDGAITLVEFGRRLRKVTLKTQVNAEQINLNALSLEGASGTLTASGTAPLDGLLPTGFDADLKATSFDISGFGTDMTALLTTRASLSGRIDPPSYAVDISTDELEVELPASQTTANHPLVLSEDIVVIDDRRGGRQAGDVDPYLAQSTGEVERTRLKVQLDLSRKSWLRHPSGDLNFTGSLGIDLLGESVVMSGSVDSIRGDFEFLGRDFKVPDKEAIARFRGADPPNPALDVEAHHPLDRSIVAEVGQAASGDPRIIVRVTGTAVEPRLDLSSDPGMAETDILFVLMTGRPPSNAGVGQDESVANQAVAAASGIFSGLLQQRLSGTLPVDMLRIETGDQGFQDSRIKVGKYITDDIFVSYAYQFGAGDEDSGYEARIEYHFLPRWMVEAVYGENNTGELNVFWDVY
jgi:autotransporter translocation and assembly factor TamB